MWDIKFVWKSKSKWSIILMYIKMIRKKIHTQYTNLIRFHMHTTTNLSSKTFLLRSLTFQSDWIFFFFFYFYFTSYIFFVWFGALICVCMCVPHALCGTHLNLCTSCVMRSLQYKCYEIISTTWAAHTDSHRLCILLSCRIRSCKWNTNTDLRTCWAMYIVDMNLGERT